MKRYLFSLCFLAFLATNTVFSQAKLNVDSLTAVLNAYPKEDTAKARWLIELSGALIKVKPNEGIAYSDKALAILEKHDAPELKADALYAKGRHIHTTGLMKLRIL